MKTNIQLRKLGKKLKFREIINTMQCHQQSISSGYMVVTRWEFNCSPSVCMGSLQVPSLPPTVQKHARELNE